MIHKILLAILLTISSVKFSDAQKSVALDKENDPAFAIASFDPKPATPRYQDGSWSYYGETSSKGFHSEMDYKLLCLIAIAERELIDKILQEQIIGSSELADPDMRTRLGKIILAAFLAFSSYAGDENNVSYTIRIVATETGELVYANTLFLKKDKEYIDLTAEAEKEGMKIFDAIYKYAKEHVINIGYEDL
jgi:hypothetical protein